MRRTIEAQLHIDADALARLAPSGNAELLAEVKQLLTDIRDRLATDSPLLVDERAAGRLLGCCPRTVFDLATRGELHPVRLGENTKRYSVDELKAWIDRQVKRERESGLLPRMKIG